MCLQRERDRGRERENVRETNTYLDRDSSTSCEKICLCTNMISEARDLILHTSFNSGIYLFILAFTRNSINP